MTIWPQDPTDPAGSRRRGRALFALTSSVGLLALAGVGCASRSDKPPALAPQTVSSVADPERETTGSPEPRANPQPPPASTIPKTIVIDPGGESDNRPSLVAAAEAERERRTHSDGSAVVINDENLKSKAVGLLTVASPRPREDPADDDAEPPATDSPAAADYWRQRVLEARRAWRELVDEIDDLESEVNLLRRRFYDEDDPYYRDSQIKPAWDRALDRLRAARLLADEAEDLVFSTLEDGRRAGAQPGWLREGVELEPTPGKPSEARPRRLREYEPGEPEIYDPDDDGDGSGFGRGSQEAAR